jgi:hypothetical protein
VAAIVEVGGGRVATAAAEDVLLRVGAREDIM